MLEEYWGTRRQEKLEKLEGVREVDTVEREFTVSFWTEKVVWALYHVTLGHMAGFHLLLKSDLSLGFALANEL
jgi:hypothetical protein